MATASQGGRLIFRKTEKELLRLSAGQDADAVHRFRTTIRRLQTLLQHLAPVDDSNQKKLLKQLNRIRKSAGELRDLDVQLTALRSLKVPQEPRRKTHLTQHLLELRAEHETRLRKLLRKSDVREIRKRLHRASKTLRAESVLDPLGEARRILGEIQLRSGPPDEELLHRYRVVVKRARYAAEFAASTAEAKQFILQLKHLQDALGHWHAWRTLTLTAVERLGDVNQSSLVAALYNVTRGKYRYAVAELSAARLITSTRRDESTELGKARKGRNRDSTTTKQAGAAA